MKRHKKTVVRRLGVQNLEQRKLFDGVPLTSNLFSEVAPIESTADVAKLHSNPEAPFVIHLDFDGHYQEEWGSRGQYKNIDSKPFVIEDDLERKEGIIRETWLGMAEDYAPFDVDVTTEEPSAKDGRPVVRVVFDHGEDTFFEAGGVGMSGGYFLGENHVAYVFTHEFNQRDYSVERTGARFSSVGSQESGHHFGLTHQSDFDSEGNFREYGVGESHRVPIMGNGSSKVRSLWWNGMSSDTAELDSVNLDRNGDGELDQSEVITQVIQDDLMVLERVLPPRVDDFASTFEQAHEFSLNANAGNYRGQVKGAERGIIENLDDSDVFKFETVGGQTGVSVMGLQHVANLDVRVEIWTRVTGTSVPSQPLKDGSVIATPGVARYVMVASDDSSESLDAQLSLDLPAGEYFLVVRSHGDYGDLGHYTIGLATNHASHYPLDFGKSETDAPSSLILDRETTIMKSIDKKVASKFIDAEANTKGQAFDQALAELQKDPESAKSQDLATQLEITLSLMN